MNIGQAPGWRERGKSEFGGAHRAMFMPASMSAVRPSTDQHAGPSVHTIFVRLLAGVFPRIRAKSGVIGIVFRSYE